MFKGTETQDFLPMLNFLSFILTYLRNNIFFNFEGCHHCFAQMFKNKNAMLFTLQERPPSSYLSYNPNVGLLTCTAIANHLSE